MFLVLFHGKNEICRHKCEMAFEKTPILQKLFGYEAGKIAIEQTWGSVMVLIRFGLRMDKKKHMYTDRSKTHVTCTQTDYTYVLPLPCKKNSRCIELSSFTGGHRWSQVVCDWIQRCA